MLTGPVIDGDGDGDAVAVGDVDGGKEPDGDVTGVVEEVAELGGVLAGAPLADRVLAADDVADWLGLVGASVGRVVGAVGVVALSVGVELGFAVALTEDADAADADCSLACAETPACEITLGVEPATSCPTRLTAVSVTAVTNAHDITQPSANARGRPVQPRSARAKERRSWRGSVGSCAPGTDLVSASASRH